MRTGHQTEIHWSSAALMSRTRRSPRLTSTLTVSPPCPVRWYSILLDGRRTESVLRLSQPNRPISLWFSSLPLRSGRRYLALKWAIRVGHATENISILWTHILLVRTFLGASPDSG